MLLHRLSTLQQTRDDALKRFQALQQLKDGEFERRDGSEQWLETKVEAGINVWLFVLWVHPNMSITWVYIVILRGKFLEDDRTSCFLS